MNKSVLLVPAVLFLASCGGSDTSVNTKPQSAIQSDSTISGDVKTNTSAFPVGEVQVTVRGTDTTATVDTSSQYSVSLPSSRSDRTVILDFKGDNIVETSIAVNVPADADTVDADVDIGTRAAPVEFNLDTGGELKNASSATRTSVTVPANAFQLPDGSIATGDAYVSITEIDIQDWSEESAWVPDMIGIRENSTEESAITSFGMSDFHFYQGDETLQLRPGAEATIKMDLVQAYTITTDDGVPAPAAAGDVLPLWHYNTEEMVWKEEGDAVVSADAGSASGFSVSGNVSHFSTWNIDKWTPSILVDVNVYFEDETGVLIEGSDHWIKSYNVVAKTVGPSWHGESAWTNRKSMTPDDRKIRVLANGADRQTLINTVSFVGGWVEMDIAVESIVLDDAYTREMGMDVNLPVSGRKIFRDYDGDHSITIRLPLNDGSSLNRR